MIVCLCEGLNDSKLRSAIEDGADTVGKLCRRTKAGSHCGMCVSDLKELVSKTTGCTRRLQKPDLMAK